MFVASNCNNLEKNLNKEKKTSELILEGLEKQYNLDKKECKKQANFYLSVSNIPEIQNKVKYFLENHTF
ncbi:MAG: hypothetical protein WC393_00725 [Candidatus Nanoarchaeia archaeon]|jgi:hypothetical protein